MCVLQQIGGNQIIEIYATVVLGVTQQAVSNSLRKLRQEFDDLLLVRLGHGMQLTPLAVSLLEPLSEAMLQLEAALSQRPSFDPAASSRTFRVGMPHYHSFVLLPQILRILAAEAPMMNLRVQAVSPPNDIASLERGDIDLLAVEDGSRSEIDEGGRARTHGRVLFNDDFVCIVDQPVARPFVELTAERYLEHPHCVLRPSPEIRMQVEQEWEKLGLAPRAAAVAPGYAVMVFTLPGTGLLATVPRKVARVFSSAFCLQVHQCPIR